MDFLKRKQTNVIPSTTTPIPSVTITSKVTSQVPKQIDINIVDSNVKSVVIDALPIDTSIDTNEKLVDTIDTQENEKQSDAMPTPENSNVTDSKKKVKMNDFLPKKIDQYAEPSVLDKKIEMKYIKDGRSHRTFVFNLELYIKDKTVLDNLINKMKKSFGTQCAYKETEFGFAYGFAGDLSSRIKQYLLDSKHVIPANFK